MASPKSTSPKSTSRSRKGGLAAKKAARVAEKRRLLGIADVKAQRHLKKEIRERLIKTESDKLDAEARRLQAFDDEQAGFATEMNRRLEEKEDLAAMARKDLHSKWSEQVYEKIEKQIQQYANALDGQLLSDRLASFMDDYVTIVNNKVVYRDIIDKSEYDPLRSKKYVCKYDGELRSQARPDGIVDPLLEPIEKVLEIHEGKEHLIKGGGLVSDLPVGKWNAVETTQHGFAAKMFDNSMQIKDPEIEGNRGRVKRNASKGVTEQYDDYTYVRGQEGTRVVLDEAGKGQRHFPQPWKTSLIGPASGVRQAALKKDPCQ